MTYNIHHGVDGKGVDQLASLAKFISKSDADIIGLQEVDSICKRSGMIDQAAYLAEQTDMNYVFVRHFPYQGGSYGLAVLSKYPIMKVFNYRLPISTSIHGRTVALLIADVKVSNKMTIKVAVAHLDYRNKNSRMKQVNIITDSLEYEELPTILMGDINAEPGSEELSILQEKFKQTHHDENLTFPAYKPVKKIDYIFINSIYPIKIYDQRVPNVQYSDHLPVLSTIMFQ